MYEVNMRYEDDTPSWSDDVNREQLTKMFLWIEPILPPEDYGDGTFSLEMYQEFTHVKIRGYDTETESQ